MIAGQVDPASQEVSEEGDNEEYPLDDIEVLPVSSSGRRWPSANPITQVTFPAKCTGLSATEPPSPIHSSLFFTTLKPRVE